jgi:hypothetical protein
MLMRDSAGTRVTLLSSFRSEAVLSEVLTASAGFCSAIKRRSVERHVGHSLLCPSHALVLTSEASAPAVPQSCRTRRQSARSGGKLLVRSLFWLTSG